MSDELFRKVDVKSAAEIIAERFDDALDLMHNDALVYGGAIRDIAAGLPILGDLDIASAGQIHNHTIGFFRMSSKWTEMRQGPTFVPSHLAKKATYKKPMPMPKKKYKAYASPKTVSPKPSTDRYSAKSISSVTTFKTFDDAKVQIMRAASNDPTKYSKHLILEIINNVDIRCCGLALDSNGTVYEVVDGAYQDCIDRVLRINKIDDDLDLDYLKDRIKKLEGRGWTSKINVSSIKMRLKKKEQEKKKAQAELAKRHNKKQFFNEWLTIEKSADTNQIAIIMNRDMVNKVHSYSTVESLVMESANARGVRVHSSGPQGNGNWIVMVSSNTGASSLCKELNKRVKRYIVDRSFAKSKTSAGKPSDKVGFESSYPSSYSSGRTYRKMGAGEEVAERTPETAPIEAGPLGEAVDFGDSTEYIISSGPEEHFFETVTVGVGPTDEIDAVNSHPEHPLPSNSEPLEPPEPHEYSEDEHSHHMEACLIDGNISITTTNRDMSPDENATIDIANIPAGMINTVVDQLKNWNGNLKYEVLHRGAIIATPIKKIRGGIIVPQDTPVSNDIPQNTPVSIDPLRIAPRSKRTKRRKRR